MKNPFERFTTPKEASEPQYDEKAWSDALFEKYPYLRMSEMIPGGTKGEIERKERELFDLSGGDIEKVTESMVLGGEIVEEDDFSGNGKTVIIPNR